MRHKCNRGNEMGCFSVSEVNLHRVKCKFIQRQAVSDLSQGVLPK